MNKKITRGILVILWLCLIFWFSNQPGEISQRQSNEVIYKIVDVVSDKNQEKKNEIAENYTFIVRKCAHLVLYFVLGILVYSFIKTFDLKKIVLISISLCLIFAILDEFHQSFVPMREASIKDVAIDTCGSLVSIVILFKLNQKK